MTAARKSFLFSLLFHALMGSLAFVVLAQMRTPPPILKISVQHMTLVSLSDQTSAQPKIPLQTAAITPPKPIPLRPLIAQPILSPKALNTQPNTAPVQSAPSIATATVPAVSASPAIQHTLQISPIAEAGQIPQKPKIDTTADMQSFKASLRSKIKQNLRYPPSARRRGMEGEVSVHFTVFGDGSIRDISVQYGEEMFHNAAKTAVASSAGIEIPKNLITSLPKEMDLTLAFKLTGE